MHVLVGGGGQLFQDILEVGVGIDPMHSAVFHQGVNHGIPVSCFGTAHEEPVLLSDCGWSDRVFDQIMPPKDLCRVDELEANIPATSYLVPYQHAA